VGVDIDFYGCVHPNNAESSNDFWGVGHLLGPEQELVVVLLPTIIETLETFWGESNRSCSCEVETARIEKI
jgi:hypothetical protein